MKKEYKMLVIKGNDVVEVPFMALCNRIAMKITEEYSKARSNLQIIKVVDENGKIIIEN